eukprot:9003816-Prorocentrum_lima.AAC.1
MSLIALVISDKTTCPIFLPPLNTKSQTPRISKAKGSGRSKGVAPDEKNKTIGRRSTLGDGKSSSRV